MTLQERINSVLVGLDPDTKEKMDGILKSLGLNAKKERAAKLKAEVVPLQEHFKRITTRCQTCDTLETRTYFMKWHPKDKCLKAALIEGAQNLEVKDNLTYPVIYCPKCPEALNVSIDSFKRILGILPFQTVVKVGNETEPFIFDRTDLTPLKLSEQDQIYDAWVSEVK